MKSTDPLEPGAVRGVHGREHSRQHSIWTLAAQGFIAYYITVMWHEIVGHGGTMYLLGAHNFLLTSTSMSSRDVPLTAAEITLGGRFALLAGPWSNAVLGLILYPLLRYVTRTSASLTLRFFLWLLTALNFYLGFIYLLFSGVFGVADYAGAIASLPHHALLRGLEIAVGLLLCTLTVRFFATRFAVFPESLWRLSLVPYVAATVVFCLAGLRNPDGAHVMMISVIPAAVLGQSILLFVTPMARKRRLAPPPLQAIPTSSGAILLALALVVIIFLTAPGVRFTMP